MRGTLLTRRSRNTDQIAASGEPSSEPVAAIDPPIDDRDEVLQDQAPSAAFI